jgi:thiol-disulfide isomerase/thioredoxin
MRTDLRAPAHLRPRAFTGLARGVLLMAALAAGCGGASRDRAPATAARADTLTLQPVTAADVQALAREPGARATLVNVWATWCGPCREEFPAIVSLAERRRADGLRVLFVSADFEDQANEARAFLAQHRAPGPWLLKAGPDMEFINGLDRRLSGALPATIVYDSHGSPVEFWEGGADSARFEAAIAPLLATRQ